MKARLAAALLAIMFGAWVFMLPLPRAVAAGSRLEWTSLVVALAFCGGAWIVAAVLPSPNRTRDDL